MTNPSRSPFTPPALTPLALSKWTGPSGELFVARPSPSALVVVMKGRVEVAAGPVLYGAITREIARAPASVYWDLWDMVWYDSDVRAKATSSLVESLARVPEIHATAQSKIVLMGVSVANIAVGGRVQSHPTREAFYAALARAR